MTPHQPIINPDNNKKINPKKPRLSGAGSSRKTGTSQRSKTDEEEDDEEEMNLMGRKRKSRSMEDEEEESTKKLIRRKNTTRGFPDSSLRDEEDDDKDKDYHYSSQNSDEEESSSADSYSKKPTKKKDQLPPQQQLQHDRELSQDPYTLKKEEDQKIYAEELYKRNAIAEAERKRCRAFIGDYSNGVILEPPNTHLWGYYSNLKDIESLIDYLDERGINESNLKANLMEKYPKLVAFHNTREKEVNKVKSPATTTGDKKSTPHQQSRRGRNKTTTVIRPFNFLYYTNSSSN
jgi:hypothetical protein